MANNTPKMVGSRDDEQFHWFWADLDSYLRDNQLKQTKQRDKIIGVFLKANSHLSAEELAFGLKEHGLSVGLATVYRTLSLLVEAGLAEQKKFDEGRILYEVATPGEHHDHLICQKCSKIVEFENDDIEDLQEKVAKKHGFVLKSHRLELFGICSDCR